MSEQVTLEELFALPEMESLGKEIMEEIKSLTNSLYEQGFTKEQIIERVGGYIVHTYQEKFVESVNQVAFDMADETILLMEKAGLVRCEGGDVISLQDTVSEEEWNRRLKLLDQLTEEE